MSVQQAASLSGSSSASALRGRSRALGIAAGQRLRHQAAERPLEQLTQAPAFHQQPILEGGIADRDAIEEIALIERGCPRQRPDRAVADQPLEEERVSTLTASRSSSDRLAVGAEHAAAVVAEAAAQPRQRLLQAVARLLVAMLAPQQAGEAVTRMGGAGADRQEGEQGAILLRRQIDSRAVGQQSLELRRAASASKPAIAEGSMTGVTIARRHLLFRLTGLLRGRQCSRPGGRLAARVPQRLSGNVDRTGGGKTVSVVTMQ